LRLAFFEDSLVPPNGQLWIIGSRRDDEPLSQQMMESLIRRKEIIEEQLSDGQNQTSGWSANDE
jgi:hypothetical protein